MVGNILAFFINGTDIIACAVKKYIKSAVLAAGVLALLAICISFGVKKVEGRSHALAQAEGEGAVTSEEQTEENYGEGIESSILGIVEGISSVAEYDRKDELDMSHSAADILVGEVSANKKVVEKNSVVKGLQEYGDIIKQYSREIVQEVQMSESDYQMLLQIVEAEATDEGLYGKLLVANVILNRITDSRFPDNVYDVVWDKSYGVAQFSPTVDGRLYKVTVTDETREAVNRAINGEDYSQGALFFVAPEIADKRNVEWFESDLVYLFTYKVHEFYTYPD